MRNASDPFFSEWVNSIRKGTDFSSGNLIETLEMLNLIDPLEKGSEVLYPAEVLNEPEICIKQDFLTFLNKDVDFFNNFILGQLIGKPHTYYSYNQIKESDIEQAGMWEEAINEYFSVLRSNYVPNHALTLKESKNSC